MALPNTLLYFFSEERHRDIICDNPLHISPAVFELWFDYIAAKAMRPKAAKLSVGQLSFDILLTLPVLAAAFTGLVTSQKAATKSRSTEYLFGRVLRKSSNSDESSVGDYVRGLHGGKYQFQDASDAMAPGMSMIGQEFASSLYGGNPCEATDNLSSEDMPRWAQQMRPPEVNSMGEECSTELIIKDNGKYASATIINLERTWEKFYAFIMRQNEDCKVGFPHSNGAPFLVEPEFGSLAPRGGASNACDPKKPYSDSAKLTVSYDSSGEDKVSVEDWWLVVGTEEEKWYYRLSLTH